MNRNQSCPVCIEPTYKYIIHDVEPSLLFPLLLDMCAVKNKNRKLSHTL